MTNQNNISFEKETKQINDEVRSKIANHLWMFCGYNDSIYPAISNDAKYIKAIFDLYNVIIDSSLITRLYDIVEKKAQWKYLLGINDYRETINMLRTIGGHTISVDNTRQDCLYKFKSWETEKCGTDNPSSEQEFNKLLDALLDIETKCLNIVKKFISDVSYDKEEKEQIIKNWEETIIDHYFKVANNNMFENKLSEWYKLNNNLLESKPNKTALYSAVNKWIMSDIYPKEKKLDEYKEIKAKYYKNLNRDQRSLLDNKIQEESDKLREIKEEVAKFSGKDIDDLIPEDYRIHYLSKEILGKKMREAIPEIKKQGLSLLPQDLFGYIIMKDMAS